MGKETNAAKIDKVQLQLEEKYDLYVAKHNKLNKLVVKESRKLTAKEDMLHIWYCKITNDIIKFSCEICEETHNKKVTNLNVKRATELLNTIVEMEEEIAVLESEKYIDHMMSNILSDIKSIREQVNKLSKSELKVSIHLLEFPIEILKGLINEKRNEINIERGNLDTEILHISNVDTIYKLEIADRYEYLNYEDSKLTSHLAKIGVIEDMMKSLV